MRIGPRHRLVNPLRIICIVLFIIFMIIGQYEYTLLSRLTIYILFITVLIMILYQSMEIKDDIIIFQKGLIRRKKKISQITSVIKMEYKSSKYPNEGKVIGFFFNDGKSIEIQYHNLETSLLEPFINELTSKNSNISICFNVEELSKYNA